MKHILNLTDFQHFNWQQPGLTPLPITWIAAMASLIGLPSSSFLICSIYWLLHSKLHQNVFSQFCESGFRIVQHCHLDSLTEAGASTSKMAHSYGWQAGAGSWLWVSQGYHLGASIPLHKAFPWGHLGFLSAWWLGYLNEWVFQDTRNRSCQFVNTLIWKIGKASLSLYSIGQNNHRASSDSRGREIDPPFNEGIVKHFVAVFNIPYPSIINYFQSVTSQCF